MESSSRSAGFTLIEIIVSISVILLLSGLFMAGYNRFNDRQKVQQAAATLIRNLQAVRTKAAFGVKPAECGALNPRDTLVGYRVDFTATGYSTQARCLIYTSGSETGVGDTKTYTLPMDVTFSTPLPGPITFYALNRGASAARTITLTGFGTTATVFVFTSGIVSD